MGNNGNAYEQRVKNEIKKRNVDKYMLLLGVRSDIDVLIRKSSTFLLPSLYEGMPLVMIEAQAAGLPCVTADTYSNEVDFGIGYVQWLKLDQSAAEWADAIKKAVSMNRADKSAVVNAVEKFGFDSRVFAKRLCDLYTESINK